MGVAINQGRGDQATFKVPRWTVKILGRDGVIGTDPIDQAVLDGNRAALDQAITVLILNRDDFCVSKQHREASPLDKFVIKDNMYVHNISVKTGRGNEGSLGKSGTYDIRLAAQCPDRDR